MARDDGSSGSSSSDDEDFGPVLPPPRKKERVDTTAAAAPAVDPPPQETPVAPVSDTGGDASVLHATAAAAAAAALAHRQQQQQQQRAQWDHYARCSELPCGALYDRSFLHDSVPLSSPVASPPSRVMDVAVLEDALGALACTVDDNGALRVWRQLPSGSMLFLGSQDRLFAPAPHAAGDPQALGPAARVFYVHTNSTLQWLVVVCVEEYEEATPQGESVRVQVLVRSVNPLTLTVDAKDACSFIVPATPAIWHSTCDDDHARPATRTGAALCGLYTRRPVLLQHRYEPHLAFFVGLPPPAAAETPAPLAASVQSGVILFRCFQRDSVAPGARSGVERAPAQSIQEELVSALRDAPREYRATPLSTAGLVVAAAQHSHCPADGGGIGTGAAQSPAVVLVDARGIIDYATIESVSTEEDEGGSSPSDSARPVRRTSGLALKIIGGLAAAPPGSPTGRLWRRWVSFDRRQRTGFFSILRDAAAPSDSSALSARHGGPYAVPLAVALSPSGKYFAVLVLRAEAVVRAESPYANTFAVSSTTRLYVFEFVTGRCLGHTDASLAGAPGGARVRQPRQELLQLHRGPCPSAASTQAIDQFAAYMADLARRVCASVVLTEANRVPLADGSGACPGLYVLVPDVALARPPVHDSGSEESATANPIHARAIAVAQVAVPGRQAPAQVDFLSQSIGELEQYLPRSVHGALSSGVCEAQGELRAPLVALRTRVAPSQDLKNLIARSPVGKALSAEELKRIVFVTSATHPDSAGSHGPVCAVDERADASTACDRVALTTSLNGTAMIAYVDAATASSDAAAHLSAINRVADDMRRLMSQPQQPQQQGELVDATGTRADGASSAEWQRISRQLAGLRDFSCARLLSLSAESLARAREERDAVASAEVDTATPAEAHVTEPAREHAAGEEEQEQSTADVVSRPPAATVPQTPAEKEDAAVQALLRDALRAASPGAPESAASPKPPRAFLQVRGYGMIEVHLLPAVAPLAVQSFLSLARRGYYSNLTFHRVIPGMMVQGGCPRGDGTGGESGLPGGGVFEDENLRLFPFLSNTRHHLWLCMANAGKDTNGSQFFITVPRAGGEDGDGLPWLNGKHTVFGYVVQGQDCVEAMSLVPRDEDDKPLKPLTIERIDVL